MSLQQDVVCWTDEKTLKKEEKNKENLGEKTPKTLQYSILRAAAPRSQKSVWLPQSSISSSPPSSAPPRCPGHHGTPPLAPSRCTGPQTSSKPLHNALEGAPQGRGLGTTWIQSEMHLELIFSLPDSLIYIFNHNITFRNFVKKTTVTIDRKAVKKQLLKLIKCSPLGQLLYLHFMTIFSSDTWRERFLRMHPPLLMLRTSNLILHLRT